MHKFVLAIAPVALLGACGDDAAEEVVAADPTGLVSNEPDPAEMPDPVADGVDSLDYSGSYTFTGLDGSVSTLTLDKAAGTYSYESPAGTTEGSFKRLDAGRIAIANFDGRPGYFSVAPGALYRLAEQTSPYNEIDPGRMFEAAEGDAMAASSVTSSEAVVAP